MKYSELKKQFKKAIKDYKKNRVTLLEYVGEKYISDEGKAVIDVDLGGMENIYRPMSCGKQTELDTEIFSFIDDKMYPIPAEVPVVLRIKGVKEGERENVARLIKEHYNLKFGDNVLDLRLNALRAGALLIIGALMFGLYFLLENFNVNRIWYEILSIIATFIVWESADFFILERYSLKTAYNDTAQAVFAEIEFVD